MNGPAVAARPETVRSSSDDLTFNRTRGADSTEMRGSRAPSDDASSRKPLHYLVQSALVGVFLAGALVVIREAAQLAVVASLGSTAFVVLALPGTRPSRARSVLGGQNLSAMVGVGAALILEGFWPGSSMAEVVVGGLAVGMAALVMTVTDTEHAPAAGTALAMVIGRSDLVRLVPAVALGSMILTCAGWLLRNRLRDLT